ncbi:hypothetical protein NUITMVRA1_10190 [Aerococcus viridans]|nr:hypothetical protein NUITMVRA1_10190 [Aerococcus viridans]
MLSPLGDEPRFLASSNGLVDFRDIQYRRYLFMDERLCPMADFNQGSMGHDDLFKYLGII